MRAGLSIRDDDDYQQQQSAAGRAQQQSSAPLSRSSNDASSVASPSSAASGSSSVSSSSAAAHAYFRAAPSASSSPSSSSSGSGSGGTAGMLQSGQPLVNIANELTDQFMRVVHLSEQTRFVKGVVLGVSLLALLSLSAYLFRDSVKTTTAEQVADVAKRSLADSDVQHQVNTLSQDVVHRLLTDQAVLSTALQFTQRLLHEPGTQAALQNLLQRLLADPKMLERGKEYSGRLVAQLTADEKVQRMVAELVKGALMQDNNREALITLLKQTVNDERSLSELRRVGSQSARDVMNDAAVQAHMTEFMKGVLADSSLQQQAGEALWSAVRYSIRPAWGKAANHVRDEKDKQHGVRPAAALGPPAVSRPISAPSPAEVGGSAIASATNGLRDTVLMTPTRAAAGEASHSLAGSHESSTTVSSADTDHRTPRVNAVPSSASSSPNSSSSPHSAAPSSQSAESIEHPDSPSLCSPLVHAPFAVASVDEEDLTPTYTITINPQRAPVA